MMVAQSVPRHPINGIAERAPQAPVLRSMQSVDEGSDPSLLIGIFVFAPRGARHISIMARVYASWQT